MLTEIKDLTVLDFFSLSYCIITICQQRDDAAKCPVFAICETEQWVAWGRSSFLIGVLFYAVWTAAQL